MEGKGMPEECSQLGVVSELEQLMMEDGIQEEEEECSPGVVMRLVDREQSMIEGMQEECSLDLEQQVNHAVEGTPLSGGDGSSGSVVTDTDQGGGRSAPDQRKDKRKAALPRWSTQVRVNDVKDATELHDGCSWRKYGQKDILGVKYPRIELANFPRMAVPPPSRCNAPTATRYSSTSCTSGNTRASRLGSLPRASLRGFLSSKSGFNTPKPKPELERPPIIILPPPPSSSNSFGRVSSSFMYPEFPAYKLFGEEKMEPVWEGREKQLSVKPESFCEKKTFQKGPTFLQDEELRSTSCKDGIAWFPMGKQRQIERPSHKCMQKVGQELLGRDDIRQQVMAKILLDSNGVNNCTVISIYGWSGFGKTSLLHVLYNDQQLLDAFDKMIWIQISEKVDIAMFFRKIIEFAMNERCSIKNTDILRELVVEEITDKKFLLFLDDADIENQQFWTTVLEVLNTGAKGSVVVMATKSSTVAAVINVATHSYSLNPLSEENNMMLLQQHAVVGSDIHSNSDSAIMANRIISRFGFNLLHLKAICGLLCHTDDFSIEDDKFEGSVMPLRFCHDILPVHLKRCLALCSLFPEGYIFDKHHMVLLWISHGCVRAVEGYELEDVGVGYFNELLCRSFFQCSPVHSDKDDMFVMHELMYNVVASVSRDKYFKSEDPMCSIPENVLHCSLISSQFQTLELMHRTEQLDDLQTFLALQAEWKPNSISLPTLNLVGLDDFFLKFTSLETLDLSHTETEELPASITGLRNLRYLSVNNTNVRALPPELCNLSNIQTLEAKHCRFLTELPSRDIKMLVKLRHLDLTKELGYVHLPRGMLAN